MKQITSLGIGLITFFIILIHPCQSDAQNANTADIIAHQDILEQDHTGYAAVLNDIPNDPLFFRQWYLNNTGNNLDNVSSKPGADINIFEAWQLTKGSENIVVAILDTGLDLDRDEFNGRIWVNNDEIPDNGIDDDRNGYIDDINGWNFVNETNRPFDNGGHGTAIAGVIAANTNNGSSISGIDQFCKIMVCKVLKPDRSGLYSDWAEGIYYAVDNGADVINMSMVGDVDLPVLSNAVRYAYDNGVVIVASTGNSNQEVQLYPAGYSTTIAVGATDPDDNRSNSFFGSASSGSNYGTHIDFVAPGNYIYTPGLNNTTSIWAGTSMSAAMVTGTISLILSLQSQLKPDEIKALLIASSNDEIGRNNQDLPGWDKYYGYGRIDAGKALTILESDGVPREEFELVVYPIPSNGFVSVSGILESFTTLQIRLFDITGRTIRGYRLNPESRNLALDFDFSDLRSGVYFLSINNGRRVQLTKLILQ